MKSSRHGMAGRDGFTLVETLATLALLCFLVTVLGPVLVRVSRQSAAVTMTQYRTAVAVAATSWAMSVPLDQVPATCTSGGTPTFAYTVCVSLNDTLPSLRRFRIVVAPNDSLLSAPDTVTLYRLNASFVDPFNSP